MCGTSKIQWVWRFAVKLCVTFVLIAGFASTGVAENISRRKPSDVVAYLRDLSHQSRIISGQNLGIPAQASERYPRYAYAGEKPLPTSPCIGLIGLDYGWQSLDPVQIRRANRVLIRHWKRGGLITVCSHMGNPTVIDGDVHADGLVDLQRILDPSTIEHRRWKANLDTIADGLGELRDAGVAVLWRPYHEMNGGWFWWCSRSEDGAWTDIAEFTAMWRETHRYFTQHRGLDNLIWVYSANVQNNDEMAPIDTYYPGDDVVDVVGLDYYGDEFSADALNAGESYQKMLRLRKPLGMTEVGPRRLDGKFDNLRIVNGLSRNCPQAAFFLAWHSWGDNDSECAAIVDNRHAAELMLHRNVINRQVLAVELGLPAD